MTQPASLRTARPEGLALDLAASRRPAPPAGAEAAGSADFGWYAVQLRPNGQALAERNLRRQGLEVFAPFETLTARRRGKFIAMRRLLFPGYMFVGFSVRQAQWRAVNSTYGVARLITRTREDGPARVPDAVITTLRARCNDADELVEQTMPAPGSKVGILRGPFADFVGTVERTAPQERVWLLLDLLGQQTRVAVPARDLRAAGDAELA